jgi:transcriptional regulator with XRE-family HTH domain
MTQEDLARKSGVTQNTISDAERGARVPHASTVRKLAAALEVEVSKLFEYDPKASSLSEWRERFEIERVIERLAQTGELDRLKDYDIAAVAAEFERELRRRVEEGRGGVA